MKAGKREKEKVYSDDICITARELIQRNEKKHNEVLSFGILTVLFFLAAAGFAGTFITAFSIQVMVPLFYPVLLVFCLFWAGFSRIKLEGVYRFLAFLAVMIGFSLLLLVMQNAIIAGFLQTVNSVAGKLNEEYDGNLTLYQVSENSLYVTVFMIFVVFLAAGLISAGMMYRPNIWCFMALLFPLAAGVLLAGGTPGTGYLFMIVLSFVGLITVSALKDPPTFWKEGDQEQFAQNMRCYESIRSKTVVFVTVLVVLLSVPAFYFLKPGLSIPIEQARDSSMKAENGILQAVWSILPRVSGGRLKLTLEGVGGGVDDGTLGTVEGYYFGNVQALKLTSSERPEETIYLKGYIGTVYSGSRFDPASEENFLNVAANWQIQDNPSLYIQNLPFLRMMYAENVTFTGDGDDVTPELSGDVTSSAQELKVENLDANDAYTYLPYNAYLNEYYVMLAGDGAVEGQTWQEDIFSYYPRGRYQETMEEWALNEDYHGVLDSAESSYENYVKLVYLQVPESGLERLKEECEAAELTDVEEIKEYVVSTLSQNYVFNRNVESLPEGEDFVNWFLYEKGEGNSTHFAAAATMMFRMFGVPARYVVGYVAPKSIFSAQSDGTYTAILEDDNAHSWTEIYLSGIGWIPVETTPGFVGVLEEADYDPLSAGTEGSELDAKEEEAQQSSEAAAEEELAEEEQSFFEAHRLVIILAGAGIVFLVVVVVGLIVHRKCLLKKRMKNVKSIYKSFYELLVFDGWKDGLGCSDDAFPAAVSRKYKKLSHEQVEALADVVLKAHYGYKKQGKREFSLVRNAYIKLGESVYRNLSFKKKLQFRLLKCYL